MEHPEGSLFDGQAVIGVRCSPMSNGGFALLLYTADSPEQEKRIRSGQEEPGQQRLLLSPEALDRLVESLSRAKAQLQAISSASGKGN
jgi:hypothetical protein